MGCGINGVMMIVSVSDKIICMCMVRVLLFSIGIQCRNVIMCIKGNYSFSVRFISCVMLFVCILMYQQGGLGKQMNVQIM